MAAFRANRSPLALGALAALVAYGLAAALGLVVVIDADNAPSALGTGFGVTVAAFLSGATAVCALACLARRKCEVVALTSVVVAGLTLDLVVLGVWRDPDSETYAKVVAIGLVLSLLALIALGLALAVDARRRFARALYLAAWVVTGAAALISTWLIATAGDDVPIEDDFSDASYYTFGINIGDDELLRVLGAALVLLATLWFGTIAAHRLERESSAA